MVLRREILSYIGTGAIGAMIGYYAGVKELLGIQQEPRPRQSEEQGSTSPTPEVITDPPETPPPETETPPPENPGTETVVVDDFENTEQLGWSINQGGRSRLEFSEDSAEGDYSLYFRDRENNSTNISRSLDDNQMSKFSFWYKYRSNNNNNFRMFLEDNSGDRVVVFQEANNAIRYWDPQKEGEFIKNTEIAQANQDIWYQVVADKIDFSSNTISISVYTSDGDLVNSVQNVGFWNESDEISQITINNALGSNGDPDPLWIDHITYEPQD